MYWNVSVYSPISHRTQWRDHSGRCAESVLKLVAEGVDGVYHHHSPPATQDHIISTPAHHMPIHPYTSIHTHPRALCRERVWESCQRTTRAGAVDGVAIIAEVRRANHPPCMVLVRQFRPPLNSYCIEVPAGLIDAGETPEQAALRELKEETGYSAHAACVCMPCCFNDPGLTDANMVAVKVVVDGDAPENVDATPCFQDGECIDTMLVPLATLYGELLKLQQAGDALDARLLSLAYGMTMAGGGP